ncbi:hypothetical protein H5410_002460 [Solanum commersonii]|uniref:Uncharacterized protein n=1 Tax=Solanum commersonii TaxID=4109 RepID=A0A9J6B2W5_SOLCO|nr:hypothetical protein H5410_002460 [Solanum commersonii]
MEEMERRNNPNKLMKLASQIQLLGKDLLKERIVEKVLKSSPKNFALKISSLEDFMDIAKMIFFMTRETRGRYPLGANRVKPPLLCNNSQITYERATQAPHPLHALRPPAQVPRLPRAYPPRGVPRGRPPRGESPVPPVPQGRPPRGTPLPPELRGPLLLPVPQGRPPRGTPVPPVPRGCLRPEAPRPFPRASRSPARGTLTPVLKLLTPRHPRYLVVESAIGIDINPCTVPARKETVKAKYQSAT